VPPAVWIFLAFLAGIFFIAWLGYDDWDKMEVR
jgi:hypothetical protein